MHARHSKANDQSLIAYKLLIKRSVITRETQFVYMLILSIEYVYSMFFFALQFCRSDFFSNAFIICHWNQHFSSFVQDFHMFIKNTRDQINLINLEVWNFNWKLNDINLDSWFQYRLMRREIINLTTKKIFIINKANSRVAQVAKKVGRFPIVNISTIS